MIRLHRRDGKKPANWRKTVEKALPDSAAYSREAARFERLHLNSEERRGGFARFAGHVLIQRKGNAEFPCCWSIAKEGLRTISHSKCAYCEVEINSPRAGHVEHFKPKSLFPSLAYEWRNYFLACAGCDGAKGDKWPEKGEYVRPDRGDPAGAFRFEADGSIHPGSRGGKARRTIDDFDLKRKWLVARRKFHIERMLEELEEVKAVFATDPETGRRLALQVFKRVIEPGAVYSAALSECFRRSWAGAFLQTEPSKRRRSEQ